ncbi:MAG: alpha-glucosidase C-terminal domain-containing protein, partial [Actinomycetes bacterium]
KEQFDRLFEEGFVEYRKGRWEAARAVWEEAKALNPSDKALEVNPNYETINAEASVGDPDSVLQHYRRLIALRHDEPAVAHGDFTMLLRDDPRIYAFTRRLDDVQLLVLGNFTGDPVVADVPDAAAWTTAELLVTNYPPSEHPTDEMLLRPWETRVYRRVG